MKSNPIIKLLLCIALPLAVGTLSAYITSHEISGEWFASLAKPSFNPPDKVFGPVWTALYILMGISLFLILNKTPNTPLRKRGIIFFGLQLLLNFFWSILFFSCHLLLFSVIDIIIMWCFILAMIEAFRKIKPIAAYLQIPYLLWVTFATLLNISILTLNK